MALDFVGQQGVEGCAVGVRGVVERNGGEAVRTRIVQPRGIGPVADDGDNFNRQSCLRNRLKVAAAPGQQHDDADRAY